MANIQDKIVAIVSVFLVMAVAVLVLRHFQNVALQEQALENDIENFRSNRAKKIRGDPKKWAEEQMKKIIKRKLREKARKERRRRERARKQRLKSRRRRRSSRKRRRRTPKLNIRNCRGVMLREKRKRLRLQRRLRNSQRNARNLARRLRRRSQMNKLKSFQTIKDINKATDNWLKNQKQKLQLPQRTGAR